MKDNKAVKTLLTVLFWIGLTLIVVLLVGGFDPLYTGNQTTKLLFGVAKAGFGYLSEDWMANARDPLPVFSWLVKVTYQYIGEWAFSVYQFILIGIYLYSLVNIADHFFQIKRSKLVYFLFLSLFLLTFSAFWLGSISGVLQDGVAGQDFGFRQFLPNGFAAFLFLGILLFLKEKPYWGSVAVAAAGNFHTGYLIGAAAIVAAFLLVDLWEKRDLKRVLMIGGLALLLVLPIVAFYYFSNAGATSAEVAEATKILVQERIPHHTQVSVWWDDLVIVKILLVLGAMLVARRMKIFSVLLVSFLIAAVPAVVVTIRPSNTIAMLQLWRVSIVTMPLATVILVAALASSLDRAEQAAMVRSRWVWGIVLGGMVLAAAVIGFSTQLQHTGYWYLTPAESDLIQYVQETGGPGELYLLPTDELYSFRLLTGQPLVVNYKSHPHSSVEVLEWHKRMVRLNVFYGASDEKRCDFLFPLVEDYGVTHVIMLKSRPLDCEGVEKVYSNDGYWVYRVLP
ncbi:MAG: DUF6798 domain-containing protein [Anaerolineales bacterium]